MDGGMATMPLQPQGQRFYGGGPRMTGPGPKMGRFQRDPQQGSGGQMRTDPATGQVVMFDGKRMRKAVHRKTVDYNSTVVQYLEDRVWQRDYRDRRAIHPDALYQINLTPPVAMLDNPMNCVTTKFIRTSTNKFRCPIFCLAWTPEGRRLVTGASSGEFTLWNGLTFNFETILQAHDTSVRAMQWSHNDMWMVTGDHSGFIKYWQTNMNNVKMYQGHKEPVRGIRWASVVLDSFLNNTVVSDSQVAAILAVCLMVNIGNQASLNNVYSFVQHLPKHVKLLQIFSWSCALFLLLHLDRFSDDDFSASEGKLVFEYDQDNSGIG